MGEAFIKIHKKMMQWEWYDDLKTFKLFMHCLLRAEYKPGSWHGISYDTGQFITSLQNLADETHLSIQEVRTALNHLISTGELTSTQQGKARIITVVKWNEYQGDNRESNKKATRKQQDANKMLTPCKEYKEDKEGKELKNNKGTVYYPNDELLNKAFINFVEMRKKKKRPLTDMAVELAQKKLSELSDGDNEKAIKILNQSILKCWQDLYPLKENKDQQKPQQQSVFDAWANA